MRIGIVADIHDAVDPLRAALTRFRELDVEQVVSLGDAFETFKRGEPGAEVALLLHEHRAIGVWGNHDVGLSHNIPRDVRTQADPDLLQFTQTLKPQLVIDNCRFSHIEPWLDPTNIMELWHFDGTPNTTELASRSFAAVPEQFLIVGHYHCWAITSADDAVAWDGTEGISLSMDRRYLILTAPVVHGWSAVFDTTNGELTPIRRPFDEHKRPRYYDEKNFV
jgi:hypothetical protein